MCDVKNVFFFADMQQFFLSFLLVNTFTFTQPKSAVPTNMRFFVLAIASALLSASSAQTPSEVPPPEGAVEQGGGEAPADTRTQEFLADMQSWASDPEDQECSALVEKYATNKTAALGSFELFDNGGVFQLQDLCRSIKQMFKFSDVQSETSFSNAQKGSRLSHPF